ncbi:MAG: glycine oxidase ThiO [Solirubrobacterales bacterium]|nr:glycine oxidase ThiO [Solirubrobacterales bacterium]
MPTRDESFKVIVIGGGVIGLAVAWRLAQRGAGVVVLERDEPGRGASHVAAGMLAPVSEADPREEPLLRLGIASAQAYPGFAAAVQEASGLDPGYLRCGTLIAARDRDEAEALERELEIRTRFGLGVRRLRPTEARRLEPALSPTLRAALEVADDHAVDPRKLTAALLVALRHLGVEVRAGTEVVELALGRRQTRRAVRLRDGRRLEGDAVVVAAGVWSAELPGLPPEARVPLRPVKGQIMRLRDPAGPRLMTRALRLPGAYLVPRGDGRYVLGATVEERGFDTTITAGAMFELLRDAVELVPGIGELVIEEVLAGLRPGTPDNAPVIGAGAVAGLHWATGHYRHGILLAPITAELTAMAVLDGTSSPLGEPFSPGRFEGRAPLRAAVRSGAR